MLSLFCRLACRAPGCDHAPVKQGRHITETTARGKAPRILRDKWPRSRPRIAVVGLALAAAVGLAGCGEPPWNNPYPQDQAGDNVLYGAFSERPKHLDPVRSYSSNEYSFIAQIYEPPLQYHFLKRPYTLVPLTAEAVPVPRYLDAQGNPLSADADPDQIAVSEYLIRIQPGIQYQPHPAFATGRGRRLICTTISAASERQSLNKLSDLPETGSRELTAEDYVYQIKRLAAPWLHSPIAGLMGKHIVGFEDLSNAVGRTGARAGRR